VFILLAYCFPVLSIVIREITGGYFIRGISMERGGGRINSGTGKTL